MSLVLGGAGKTFTLHFDTNANAQLASVLAANISAGVLDHSISPSNDATPPLSGKIGEFVDTKTPVVHLPHGYDAVVNVNANATIFGSGGNGESVLSGASNLTFVATGGSGTVVAGAGSPHKGQQEDQGHKGRVAGGNTIVVPLGDHGNWLIETGGGNDTISAEAVAMTRSVPVGDITSSIWVPAMTWCSHQVTTPSMPTVGP